MPEKLRDKELEIPPRCPHIVSCGLEVGAVSFETRCKTTSWIYCSGVPKEERRRYLLKPREWNMIEKIK